MIGAIRYGRVPKKEEGGAAAPAAPAGTAESGEEKSILEFTMGEPVSVAAGDPIIKGDGGVFINTPIDGTFNGGTAENIEISGIDKSKFGIITSKRVYKKDKQLEKAEDIPKDVTFADIRVEVNFPPDETDGSSPDLTQYLYNFTPNTSVKIKQTEESCVAFLEKNKDNASESTKEKIKKVAGILSKLKGPSKFEKFKKLLASKFTGGIEGFKGLFTKHEIPLPPEVVEGLKEQTEDSKNCSIGATSPDPVTFVVTTAADGTISIKSDSGTNTLQGLFGSLAKKEEDKDKDGDGGEDGKNAGASDNDTTKNQSKSLVPAGNGKPPAGAGEDQGEEEATEEDADNEDAGAGESAGSLDENASSNVSDPLNQGNSPPTAPQPPGKPNVPVRPNRTALLQRTNQRNAAQAEAAAAKESQMKESAVTNLTSNTGPISPEANKQLTEYKTIFDAVVETTVKKYIKYDDEMAAVDPTPKKDPSYPLTSFALVFNNNFNWKANTTDPEYPISSYNLQLKLPALTRIYETRRNLYEAATKIMAKVNEYVTKIIDEKIRIGDAEGATNQRALLLEIIELLKTSEFNDATSEKIFTDRVKKDLGLNVNDFYMNEIWRHLIKPYGDIKRFVEAIINTNSTIRKQIDESIRGKKPGVLTMYKETTTAILSQIGVFLEEDNTQNNVFNDNKIAIAFDILFLLALFKRKEIATSGLGKSKNEYEKIIKLLNLANTRISEFFGILDAKNKIFIGFKKLSTKDNEQIIADFKRLLCDDAATHLYLEDIGKNLPQGELRENVLKLFKLVRETFKQECDKCSTLLNCSGPKLVTFLEKSKEIKGLLNGLRGGIIGSVNREISDLESKITNVIKSAAFSFDLYGVNSTFNEVNFDIVKDKLSRNKSENVSAKLNTQPDATKENTEDNSSQLAVYASVLKNYQDKLPSFTVKAFNSVSMDNLSEGYNRAAAAAAAADADADAISRRKIDAEAKASADEWWAKYRAERTKTEATAKANLPETSAASPPVSGPPQSIATSNIEAVVVDENAAHATGDASSTAPAIPSSTALAAADAPIVQAVALSSADSSSVQQVNPPAAVSHDTSDEEPGEIVDINHIDVDVGGDAAGGAGGDTASTGNVGGKTRRNNPKIKNKQSRKQNKVIYRIPHKSSSYKSKNGRSNSAKSKNTRRHK